MKALLTGQRVSRIVGFLGLALLLTGCGPTLVGLRVDKSFTYDALKSNKVGVGGVVTAAPNPKDDQRLPRANLFTRWIAQARPGVDVINPGTVTNRAGDDVVAKAQEEYRKGDVSRDTLQALHAKLGDVRYLAFARIESDTTAQDRHEGTQPDSRNAAKQVDTLVSQATRTVAMAIDIYDLTKSEAVWSVLMNDKKSNQNSEEKDKDIKSKSAVLNAIAAAAKKEQKYPKMPPAPDTNDVLADMFKAVGDNLPKGGMGM